MAWYVGHVLHLGRAGAFAEAGDSGKAAQRISNASFATLSLIYSLTEVLDLADSLSTLAGLTARVADLRQVHSWPCDWTINSPNCIKHVQQNLALHPLCICAWIAWYQSRASGIVVCWPILASIKMEVSRG